MVVEPIEEKPSNPKDLIGTDKIPMLLPGIAIVLGSLAHLEGNLKYGLVNWREAGVRSSIYLDALMRHYLKYREAGEDKDPTTDVPHLASIIACCAIILDAALAGKLTDDRPKPNPGLSKVIDQLTGNVKHLKVLFADKHPKHYTIEQRTGEEVV